MDHMFGNPGTVEQGFLDALADYPEMKYVLTLQESVAVMTADGYARATQTAHAGAASQHARHRQRHRRALPGQARPLAAGRHRRRRRHPVHGDGRADGGRPGRHDGAGHQVVDHGDGPVVAAARARAAPSRSPPRRPWARSTSACRRTSWMRPPWNRCARPRIPSTRVVPDGETLRAWPRRWPRQNGPSIFVGDGVAYSGAQDELTRVAELLGRRSVGSRRRRGQHAL